MKDYAKPPINIADQISLLKKRGLVIANDVYAQKVLSYINYYRLSGYCLPFEISRHHFKESATFEQVVALYEYDKQLRNLIDQALELIEIQIRTTVVHCLTTLYGAFAHEDIVIYYKFPDYNEWLQKVHHEINRSREIFVQHYQTTYNGFPKIPFWVAVEIMSFGSLSKMISHLLKKDQIRIAQKFNLHHTVFLSWLHTFVYIRNICAHHSRLWDKSLAVKLKIPSQPKWENVDIKRIASVIKAISYMLEKCNIEKDKLDKWRKDLICIVETTIPDKDLIKYMGFSDKWKDFF